MKILFSALTAAVAVACATPVLAQAPTPPPIEAYAAFPALSEVSVSPDGSKIAFVAVGPSGGRVMAVRGLNGEDFGSIDVSNVKVRDVMWAGDDHVIITTSKYTDIAFLTDRGEFYNAQSYNIRTRRFALLMNRTSGANGGTANRLFASGTGELNIVAGAPFQHEIDGRVRTFVYSFDRSYTPALFEVDLDTGVGTLQPTFEGVMGPHGLAVAREDMDKDGGRWWVSAKAQVGWKPVWSGSGYTIDWPSLLGVGRSEDTVLIRVPDSPRDVIYEVSLTTGASERLRVGTLVDPSPIYHRLNGRLLGFVSLEGDEYRYVFTDTTIATAWASIRDAYTGERVRIVSATPDYGKIVIERETDQNPGSYSLVDMTAGTAVNLGSQYPGLARGGVSEVRYITYRAADGLEIPAYLTLPYGRDPHDLPLVVMPHGGPQARDYPGFDDWSQVMASRGYAVLRPQFRGSEGFGNAHLEAGYGEWGRKMQSDLTDGVHYLRDQGIVDPARVCIFGWSYGGYAAMAGVTLDPETYRCAIAGAGVSDLPRMLAWERDQTGGKDTLTMRFWKRFMGADRINDNSISQVSPARLADRVRAPVLLIHGRDDSVVPYEQSELFQRALQRAGKDVEMIELHGEDHWMSSASGRLRVSQALIDFLNRHNPAN